MRTAVWCVQLGMDRKKKEKANRLASLTQGLVLSPHRDGGITLWLILMLNSSCFFASWVDFLTCFETSPFHTKSSRHIVEACPIIPSQNHHPKCNTPYGGLWHRWLAIRRRILTTCTLARLSLHAFWLRKMGI